MSKIRQTSMMRQEHKCTLCQKSFSRPRALRRHGHLHTGNKPYKCTTAGCRWTFAQSVDLKRHIRKHTGEQPYRCTVKGCGRLFSRLDNLKQHKKRLHAGERTYQRGDDFLASGPSKGYLKRVDAQQGASKVLASSQPDGTPPGMERGFFSRSQNTQAGSSVTLPHCPVN